MVEELKTALMDLGSDELVQYLKTRKERLAEVKDVSTVYDIVYVSTNSSSDCC